ncbi:hypothetical protein [Flammeovirga sp. OC4]|uniref:hypothetical protein n=1 Tax=Flammeovirga sp. OC4 TaxID=1382345 RepID=UPI0005C5565B|nr:hypothetical protein [Flammeovirga sp. OC4]
MKIKHLLIANIVAFSVIACGQAEQNKEEAKATEEVVEVAKEEVKAVEAEVAEADSTVAVADSTVAEEVVKATEGEAEAAAE